MYISEIILHISYFKAGNDLNKTFHKDNTHNIKYSEKIIDSLEKLESCTRLLILKIRLMRNTLFAMVSSNPLFLHHTITRRKRFMKVNVFLQTLQKIYVILEDLDVEF